MAAASRSLLPAWLAAATLLAGCIGRGEEADTAAADVTVELASLNFLHGLLCPDLCRIEDRAELLASWIQAAGCPDLVALQEMWEPSREALEPSLEGLCPFSYNWVSGHDPLEFDDEVLLSRYPVRAAESVDLEGGFHHVLHAVVEHPTGQVDVLVTHFTAGADGGDEPCPDCPASCAEAGGSSLRDCEAIQLAELARSAGERVLVAGDLNAPPGSFEYEYLAERLSDAWVEAGLPECEPETGTGCTAGREDTALDGIESPEYGEDERIDYVFLGREMAGGGCSLLAGGTGGFADEPNPFSSSCGPAPEPPCWPSDHVGVRVSVDCSD